MTTPAQQKRMAQERAKPSAAGADPAPGSTEQARQYLTFMLGGESFAMGILAIKEIIEYANVTGVPMMPAYVRGVINLRGSVVPVIDLSVRFGRAPSPPTKRTCIVILEIEASGERLVAGVVVDAVNAVLDIPAGEIEPPPAFGARISTDFIEGLGKVNGTFVILLDVNHVLHAEDMRLLSDASEATTEAA